MNLRGWIVVALALVVMLGCTPARRRHDAYQELLNAEKRWLEDQIYDLNFQYSALQDKYESTLRENDALRRALQQQHSSDKSRDNSSDTTPPESVSPSGAGALRPPVDLEAITPPEIDLGEPAPSLQESPPLTPPAELLPGSPPEPMLDGTPAAPSAGDFPTTHGELVDPRVTHIYLNPRLTGGADLDGRPGDDGISVVIEPRNAAGQFVAVAGALSIVVLDPALQGEAARVARWDFTVHETREMMTESVFGKGIHLRLPWPNQAPTNAKLHLFVRYTAADGSRLEADREIFVEPPGHVSARWTPLVPGNEGPAADSTVMQANFQEPSPMSPDLVKAAKPLEYPAPPAGPTVSEKNDRPEWRPYR